MKHAQNNEIDLLLKAMARRASAEDLTAVKDPADQGHQTISGHLDADELSSFAEGVLPTPTRALYAAHLADCARCRRIVVQLATASGAGVGQLRAGITPKTGIWNYLATFFTPGVLRYAVPALSLIVLGAIGLTWMRHERQREMFVAQNTPATNSSEAPRSTDARLQDQTKEAGEGLAATRTPSERSSGAKRDEPPSNERESKQQNDTAARVSAEKSKESPKTSESTVSAASPSVARVSEMNAPPPHEPQKAVAKEVAGGEGEVRSQPAAADTAQSQDRSRRDKDEAANKKAEAKPAVGPATVTGSYGMRDQKSGTRSVGGRHFRRDNNVWVDTAYEGSAATTNVTRGSEQYRSLMGDEPGLRTIAEQLDGEIVVVWKGKAYRIR